MLLRSSAILITLLALVGISGCSRAPDAPPSEGELEFDVLCGPDPLMVHAVSNVSWIGNGYDSTIQWSPDGSRILFDWSYPTGRGESLTSLLQGPHSDVYAVQVDGSRVEKIVDASSGDPVRDDFVQVTSFDTSPDGSRIVYSACAFTKDLEQGRGGDRWVYNYEISVSNIDGTGLRRLTENTHLDILPAWSPDGASIAFISAPTSPTSSRDRNWSVEGRLITIHTVATGVSRDIVLPNGDFIGPHAISWSPDGQRIAFVAYEGEYPWKPAVYTVGADGSELTRISDAISGPAWSPDGERIAIVVPEKGSSFGERLAMVVPKKEAELALYTFSADGSDPVKLDYRRPHPQDVLIRNWRGDLSWSPDGSGILVVNSDGLVVEVDGSNFGNLPANSAATVRGAGGHPGVSGTGGFHIQTGVLAAVVDGPDIGSPPMRLAGGVSQSGGNTVIDIPDVEFATWSPDGSKIAVRTGGLGAHYFGFELYVVNRDGTGRRDLVKRYYMEEGQFAPVPVQDSSRNDLDR